MRSSILHSLSFSSLFLSVCLSAPSGLDNFVAQVEVDVESTITGNLHIGSAVGLGSQARQARKVFAHYLIGTTTREHCIIDIQDAQRTGLDGFSLDLGFPSASWAINATRDLFAYAEQVGFLLIINMDMSEAGGVPHEFDSTLQEYINSPSYYKVDGKPFISTFDSGGLNASQWAEWKDTALNSTQMYFCPDFDDTVNYYNATDAWWETWGNVPDCLLSWESMWEARPGFLGSAGPGSIELDIAVIDGTSKRGKGYQMGISSLQYKDAYGTNIFRPGGLTLVNRMVNILGMQTPPNTIEVVSWNDGPESHYIGNNWPEQNGDADPARYVTPEPATNTTHRGWQSLVWSFADAWRTGKTVTQMTTPENSPAVGAIWYKRVLHASNCSLANRPDDWQADPDAVTWAIVLHPDLISSDWSLKIISGGNVTTVSDLKSGLNYGQVGAYAGSQSMELHHVSGAVPMVAQGGTCISLDCPGDLYDMNPIVRELKWEFVVKDPVCSCTDNLVLVNGQCVSADSTSYYADYESGVRVFVPIVMEDVASSIENLLRSLLSPH